MCKGTFAGDFGEMPRCHHLPYGQYQSIDGTQLVSYKAVNGENKVDSEYL